MISFKGCTIFERKMFMSNKEDWNEFLSNLLANAVEKHRQTAEYEYYKEREKQIDKFLLEYGFAEEREAEVVYYQGLKDCIWLLKNLGVMS